MKLRGGTIRVICAAGIVAFMSQRGAADEPDRYAMPPTASAPINPTANTPAPTSVATPATAESIYPTTATPSPYSNLPTSPEALPSPVEGDSSEWVPPPSKRRIIIPWLMPGNSDFLQDERPLVWPSVGRFHPMPEFGQIPEPPATKIVHIGGWDEIGYTFNANSPPTDSNFPVGFNNRSDRIQFDQLYLYSEAIVGSTDDTYFASRLDVLYGSDAIFVEVPGLERHEDNRRKWNSNDNDNGLALPQFYGEIGAPFYDGLALRVGHFYALSSYEGVPAPENFFYSHSYTFMASPKTYSGALLRFNPCESDTFYLGYTQGVNNLDSDPARWGILWGVAARSDDRQTIYSLMFHAGNDISTLTISGHRQAEAREYVNFQLRHFFGERWEYVFEPFSAIQKYGSEELDTIQLKRRFGPAEWYGINQYLFCHISNTLDAGLRAEWFRDDDHFELGVPITVIPDGPLMTGGNFYEITAGINYHFRPNLSLRPEIRWDWSDVRGNANVPGINGNYRPFGGHVDDNQLTLATDLVWTF
jgi:hypothetical protein